MSSVVTKIVFTVAIGVIGAIAAYFLSNPEQQRNRGHEQGRGSGQSRRSERRARRPSTPPPTNKDWYVTEEDQLDVLEGSQETESSSSRPRQRKNKNDMCTICWEKYENLVRAGHDIHSTLCGHIFCEPCIEASLRQKPSCPQCRGHCEPGSTHPIYIY